MHILYILSYIIFITDEILGVSAPIHLLVTRVGPCDLPGAKITVSECDIRTKTTDAMISGVLNVSQDIHNGWKIYVTMHKCWDIRNTDTCDFFKSFYVVKNGCEDEDEDERDLYDMFVHYTHPRLDCPVEKGMYRIERYPIFTGEDLTVPESKISTSMFGYTMRLDGLSHNRKKLLCVEAYVQLMYIRDHNWQSINTTTQANDEHETNKQQTSEHNRSDSSREDWRREENVDFDRREETDGDIEDNDASE